jgi:heavy metal sensor kinase
MKFSIRTRLTLWYATLLTVSLITFSMSFFYTLSKFFMDRTDEHINSVAGMMVHTIIQPPGVLRLPKNFDVILGSFFGIRTRDIYIQVLTPDGRVAGRSSSLGGFSFPLSDETYKDALEGETIHEIVDTFGRYPVRVVTKPIVLRDRGLVAIVQVGSSLEGREKIFHYMFSFFGGGTLVSVLIASVVGWFLAGKALKPVDDITTMARRIGAESLDERLKIKGPRDEIGRLAATFNEMIARLERSFKQVRQFTADASHELKTPLTVLKGEMEVALRAGASREELEEVIVSSLEETDRMSYIVKNLLDLARADVEAVKTEVMLDGVLTERFEHFRKMAVTEGIELDILRNTPVTVPGDPVRLGQLIYNLIDNAFKYTPRGGKVELSLEDSDGEAILKVMDTGVGIANEDVPYVFDRFFRVDKARTSLGEGRVGGVGLGLSICKEIVDSHGGTIEVTSEPGKGSTFTARLPVINKSVGGS